MSNKLKLSEFDYNLPQELIAQEPSAKRQDSRMLVLDRNEEKIEHKHFYDITDYLNENDLLVLNNTKVIPARLLGKKTSGANIEILLLKETETNIWEVLLKPSKRLKPNDIVIFSDKLKAKIIEKRGETSLVELIYSGDLYEILDSTGHMPLPPYIQRNEDKKEDLCRYQTVFAKTPGSVAAPTAGLHFSEEIIEKLIKKGVEICYVTLNVGLGTFKPVSEENIENHKMHFERYEISKTASQQINNAIKSGKNITAVGTTSVRTLETCFKNHGAIIPIIEDSNLFIYPPYKYNVVNKLITNFHLPKSTLLMLISAFATKEFIFKAYEEAIKNKYRFFSYGDCMLIL